MESRKRFPVTIAEFGIKDYCGYTTQDGYAYAVTLIYRGVPVCHLRNTGYGAETDVIPVDVKNFKGVYEKVLDILQQINSIVCKYMKIKSTFLYDVYMYDLNSTGTVLTGFFELLYELNDVYSMRNTTDVCYMYRVCGNGNLLVATETYKNTGGVGIASQYNSLIGLVNKYKGSVLFNYVFKLKERTRVLHLSVQDIENGLALAQKINVEALNVK